MGRACDMHGEEVMHTVLMGNSERGDALENQDLEGSIILKWILNK